MIAALSDIIAILRAAATGNDPRETLLDRYREDTNADAA